MSFLRKVPIFTPLFLSRLIWKKPLSSAPHPYSWYGMADEPADVTWGRILETLKDKIEEQCTISPRKCCCRLYQLELELEEVWKKRLAIIKDLEENEHREKLIVRSIKRCQAHLQREESEAAETGSSEAENGDTTSQYSKSTPIKGGKSS